MGRAESNTVRSKLSSDFIQFAVVGKRCLRNVRHALRTAGALLFVCGVGAPALLASRRLASALCRSARCRRCSGDGLACSRWRLRCALNVPDGDGAVHGDEHCGATSAEALHGVCERCAHGPLPRCLLRMSLWCVRWRTGVCRPRRYRRVGAQVLYLSSISSIVARVERDAGGWRQKAGRRHKVDSVLSFYLQNYPMN